MIDMQKLYGFQCPKCYIRSGNASTNINDAPSCCGGVKMIAYEIPVIENPEFPTCGKVMEEQTFVCGMEIRIIVVYPEKLLTVSGGNFTTLYWEGAEIAVIGDSMQEKDG